MGKTMPSGDAQRVWFPEMLEELRNTWSSSMAWEQLADFCERMTVTRRAIRKERGIQPPQTRCPACGVVSRSDIRGVSVRSALFALRKMGAVNEAEFKALDKSWKKHRAATGVDAFGRHSVPVDRGREERADPCC